jgi:hypothetical protein
MSPEQKAVFSSLSVDEAFAGQEMGKKIRSMRLATEKETRKSRLALGERRLGLRRREHEFAKKQILPATIAGLGEVAAGVYGGLQRRQTSQQLARLNLSLAQRYTTPAPPQRMSWGATPTPTQTMTEGATLTPPRQRRPY